MDKERYILVDENDVVLAVVEGTSVFDLLDTGIPFHNAHKVEDIVPQVGDKFYKG
jgi:hypothetical protein